MQAVLILVCLPLSYAGNHTMQRHFTAMPGIKNFPEYMESERVDGEIITHYTSITERTVPVQMCMKNLVDPQYWNTSAMESKAYQDTCMKRAEDLKKKCNQTGLHPLQELHSCWWEDKSGDAHGDLLEGYDGEDLPNELSGKDVSDINEAEPAGMKLKCIQRCIEHLKMYVQHGKGCLGRKVPPEVFVFLGSVSSSAVCHATGFHPKAVNMTWKRDGEVIQEDVYVGETLPNGDGTYQKRAVLTVSPEERERSQYTCEVEHAGVLIIKTLTEPGWSSGLITGIASAITAAIFLGGLVYYFYCRGQRSSTSQGGTGSAQTLMAQPVQYRSVDPSKRVPG